MTDWELWLYLIAASGWAFAFICFRAADSKSAEAKLYKEQFEKLSQIQNKAFEKVVDSHTQSPTWKKRAQVMTKPRAALKVVASNGKRLYDANVVSVDFRAKYKKSKGPDGSGPKGVA